MTTGLPAWVAICAVLTVQMRPARADGSGSDSDTSDESPKRRQVAVIDLTDDADNTLTGNLWKAINASDDFQSPDKRDLDPWLTGRFVDEDSDHISQASVLLTSARSRLDEANAPTALSEARSGQAELAQAFPTPEVQALYVDLSLVVGLAMLDEGKAQEASYALALVHRLAPSLELDPVRYPPDTIAAFKHASEMKSATIALELKGTGQVWIDFADRGMAPATFDGIEVGEHVITVSGIDRVTTPVLPIIPTKGASPLPPRPALVRVAVTIGVPEINADEPLKVQRARRAFARAQAAHDDAARASAMKRMADLLGVGDAIILSKRPDGKLQWETWRDRAPGFSAPQAYTNQNPETMLDGLAPAHRNPSIRTVGPPPFTGPIAVEQPWYDKGWVQISGATGVIIVIVGIILLSTRDHPINFNPGDIKVSQ
jgi:hypothetical protein